jgi:hypothetical protein
MLGSKLICETAPDDTHLFDCSPICTRRNGGGTLLAYWPNDTFLSQWMALNDRGTVQARGKCLKNVIAEIYTAR